VARNPASRTCLDPGPDLGRDHHSVIRPRRVGVLRHVRRRRRSTPPLASCLYSSQVRESAVSVSPAQSHTANAGRTTSHGYGKTRRRAATRGKREPAPPRELAHESAPLLTFMVGGGRRFESVRALSEAPANERFPSLYRCRERRQGRTCPRTWASYGLRRAKTPARAAVAPRSPWRPGCEVRRESRGRRDRCSPNRPVGAPINKERPRCRHGS
jgi:hypothetical protein